MKLMKKGENGRLKYHSGTSGSKDDESGQWWVDVGVYDLVG